MSTTFDPARLGCRFFGLRHGQSEANVAGIVLSDPATGVPGYGLTAEGRAQVRASVTACPDLSAATRIVSSDFARAALGADPIRLDPALRERWFGTWEGTSNANYERVWTRDRDDPDHTVDGVEAVTAVCARATALVEALAAEHPGETLLLVAHGDTLQILATAFAGRDPRTHRAVPHWAAGEVRDLRTAAGLGTV